MKEREERIAFASREETGGPTKKLRIVLRCPVIGCPRVEVKEAFVYPSGKWKVPRHLETGA